MLTAIIQILARITFFIVKYVLPILIKLVYRVLIPIALLSLVAAVTGVGGFIIVLVVLYLYTKKVLTYTPAKYNMPT